MRRPKSRTPRIAVTLPTGTRVALDRLAKLTGQPASRIIADCLAESGPAFQRIADAIERVHNASAQQSDAIRSTLAAAEDEARENALTVLGLLDRIAATDKSKASAGGGAPARGGVPARRRRTKREPMSPLLLTGGMKNANPRR